jgi:hypothetical protein
MHVADSAIVPVSHADEGDWHVESNSASQPTSAELATRLSDAPATDTPVADADPSPTTPDQPDEPAASALLPERDAKTGKFKKSSSERRAELQAEFNAETRKKHNEIRAREAVQREREQIAREVAQLKAEREALAKPAASETKPADLGPKPKWQDYEAAGKSYSEYEDAKDAWLEKSAEAKAIASLDARQKLTEAAAKQAHDDARERERAIRHDTRIATAKAKYPDFETVVNAAAVSVPEFVEYVIDDHPLGADVLYALSKELDRADALNGLNVNGLGPRLYDALMSSEDPVATLAIYVDNHDELKRIGGLPPAAALVALGRLEARMSGANHGSPAPAPTTNAPKPIQPVGKSRSVATNADDPEDILKWIELENEKARKEGR